MHNIFNHFQKKLIKIDFFHQKHNIFNQEGNRELRTFGTMVLRPTGLVEVQEGNLRCFAVWIIF
jgi:hypothetical protein